MNQKIRAWATVTAIALSFAVYKQHLQRNPLKVYLLPTFYRQKKWTKKLTITLQLSENTSGSAVSYFHKTDPFEVVIDVSDANIGPNFAPKELVNNIDLFKDIQVTVNNYEDGIITQVIFSLTEQVEYQVQVSGSTISIDFQSSPASSDAMADLLGDPAEDSKPQIKIGNPRRII